ncbi:YidH family protein [Pseudalkalibacillus sp. JSM 102089]|uniref:YidH family protein n=1 Tax=Pseudalkalibacillus sp. JSM 102089 TaxID=3229856 RepID=UPI0035250526
MENKKADGRVQQLLANERTFLAWVRTSIAIIGIGFLTASLHFTRAAGERADDQVAVFISFSSLFFGLLTIAGGAVQFYRTKKRIMKFEVPSSSWIVVFLLIVVLLMIALIATYFIIQINCLS